MSVRGLGWLGDTGDDVETDPGSAPEPEVLGTNNDVIGNDPSASSDTPSNGPSIVDILEGAITDPFAIDKQIWGALTGGSSSPSTPRPSTPPRGSGGGALSSAAGALFGGGSSGGSSWSPILVAGGVAALILGGAVLLTRKRRKGRR